MEKRGKAREWKDKGVSGSMFHEDSSDDEWLLVRPIYSQTPNVHGYEHKCILQFTLVSRYRFCNG